MKVSKNQVVCERCHLAGEASGKGWIVESASLKGAARSSVSFRVANSLSFSAFGARSESSRAMAALPCHETDVGTSQKFTICSLIGLIAHLLGSRSARLPEHVAALGCSHVACGDEQMVGEAVEVGDQVRVQRLAFVQRDGGTLGAADHGASEVQRRNGWRAARKDEARERFK